MTPVPDGGPATPSGRRPPWLLSRPDWPEDQARRDAFDAVFADGVRRGPGTPIDDRLAAPKAQFLCHVADRGLAVLHGSGRSDIAEFEPRQAIDASAFGARRGVYAARDGLWPLFFAVLDRDAYQGLLLNTYVGYGDPPVPGYFFSLDARQLAARPWRSGVVYLLPPATFDSEQLPDDHGTPVRSTQCCSPVPVTPLATLAVEPADFPFLDQVVGHDEETVWRRSRSDPDGFPWLD